MTMPTKGVSAILLPPSSLYPVVLRLRALGAARKDDAILARLAFSEQELPLGGREC